ncbi:MAG: hypothetical protein KDA66_17860 [Planctomycetaceae bacterium]|nr:hypothetical protein [Planctomycetaceae bacterium]
MASSSTDHRFPVDPFPDGMRLRAGVTLLWDNDDAQIVPVTVVDVAPGKLRVTFPIGHGQMLASYQYRVVGSRGWTGLLANWYAAAFARPIPISLEDVERLDERTILIAPPWPLDYQLKIQLQEANQCDDVLRMLEAGK